MVEEYRAQGAPPPIDVDQQHADPSGPHKYKWAFHAPPVTGPGGHVPMQMPEEWSDDLGRHIESLGFITRDELVALADADGVVDVNAIPGARIRHDPPQTGPRSWLNPGQWVPVSAPPPTMQHGEVDLSALSDEEAEAVSVEAEAIREALRRREVWKSRLADEEGGER